MPKRDTIDAIRSLNPTASPDFLAEFSSDQLSEYLDRLAGLSKARPFDDARCAIGLEEPPLIGSAVKADDR